MSSFLHTKHHQFIYPFRLELSVISSRKPSLSASPPLPFHVVPECWDTRVTTLAAVC